MSKHDDQEDHKLNIQKDKNGKIDLLDDESSGRIPKITFEPVSAMSGLIVWMCQTSIQNLYLESACTVDLKHPRNECMYGIGAESIHEVDSQRLVSSVNIIRGFIESIVIMCVLLFICPWSDYSGRRKNTMILPFLGLALSTVIALLVVTFPGLSVTWVIYLIQFPQAVTGSQFLFFVGLYNYIGDLCFTTSRNMATSCIVSFIAHFSSIAVGTIAGPVLLRYLGYYGVFGIAFAIQIVNLVYLCKYVKDVKLNKSNKVSLLSIHLPLSALKCVFKKRDGYKRCCILLMIAVDALDKVIYTGDLNIQYLFIRKRLGWSDVLYGLFLTYKYGVLLFGLLFVLFIMKNRLKVTDNMVGICGGVSQALAILTMMVAPNAYVLFLVPIIGFLTTGCFVVQRAVLNKHIQIDEQGKVGSIIGALDAVVLVAITPLFNTVYKLTVDVFPGAYMCINIMSCLVQIFSYVVTKMVTEKLDLKTISEEEPMNKGNGNL